MTTDTPAKIVKYFKLKNMKPKIIVMYLPQFHQIPENDEFWGEGFSDWVTVMNAKPMYHNHKQPRVPLNNNYYDLSIKDNVVWQAKLARKYGIYGFGIYHYWFNNEKNLLTKPAEIILNNDIDINFFFTWDNISWKRSWSNVNGANDWAPNMDTPTGQGPAILIPYILGKEEDWEKHYLYLLPYFKDPRYIKKDNKPMFAILHYNEDIANMCKFWEKLAIKDGFDGMFFVFQHRKTNNMASPEYVFKYEPAYSGWDNEAIIDKVKRKVRTLFIRRGGIKTILKYDVLWQRILRNAREMKSPYVFHGALVSFDDTPRRGVKARLIEYSTPQKFEKYMTQLISISMSQNKEFIFVIAWNEWGEGAMLEPDEINGYSYLEALNNAIKSNSN